MLSIDGLSAAALPYSTASLLSIRGLISGGAHAHRLSPGCAADIPTIDEAYTKLKSEADAPALLRQRHPR